MPEDKIYALPALSDELLSAFKSYYQNDRVKDPHFLEYKNFGEIVQNPKVDDEYLKESFLNFQLYGGGIQSGGGRDNPDFKNTVYAQWKSIKPFLFEPFASHFDVKSWLLRLDRFSHFGRGCATIYLNRINPIKYPVLNGKSEAAFKKLFRIKLPSNTVKAYFVLMDATDMLMKQYFSTFEDKTELDSFFHFIVADTIGKQAFADFQTSADLNERDFENAINEPSLSALEDKKIRQSEQRVRNQKLRQSCLKRYGYNCIVCDFIFSHKYGEIGNGFIEVHHLNPLAKKNPDEHTTVYELRPVCANCHRILHRKNSDETYHTIESLRRVIEKHKKQTI